ncbi:MAG TPA: FAD-dependent oxidoreductase, partial [Solirubrobacteraceae bacterium]|nr:FAD-dependent oxidoreductase [Solirubrobacteraceae bacterium]
MAESSYDCIVIGSGPGGYVAAIRAAQLGMRTAVVEKDRVGGRCLNYACIPAKAVLRSADLLSEVREAEEFGLRVGGVEVDYPAVQTRREKVVGTLTSGVSGLFKKNGIDLIEGEARLLGRGAAGGGAGGGSTDGSPGPLAVLVADPPGAGGGTELEAGVVILATGSVRRTIPGVEFGGAVIGTEEAWALPELPGRLAVAGAGASGAEIASGFARLGSEVVLFETLDRVLPTEDADISRLVERGLKRQGIEVLTGTAIEEVGAIEGGVSLSYAGANGPESTTADHLVIAAGRGADVEALGLAASGVELDTPSGARGDQGLVKVDGAMRTSVPGVYAIGDLVPGPALAHKASDEGIIAAEDSAGL